MFYYLFELDGIEKLLSNWVDMNFLDLSQTFNVNERASILSTENISKLIPSLCF